MSFQELKKRRSSQPPALMRACKFNREEVVKVLLRTVKSSSSSGRHVGNSVGQVKIDEVDAEGHSGLHLAAISGFVDIVRLLLRAGSNVNLMTNVDGYTPLMFALEAKKRLTAEMLLESPKLDVTIKNNAGQYAHDFLPAVDDSSGWKQLSEQLHEKFRKQIAEGGQVLAPAIPQLRTKSPAIQRNSTFAM